METNFSRAWVISDLHFGVHASKLEWINIQLDYFNNFFIPLLEREKRDGDALFILGDVFENRESLNILVMCEALQIFDKLSSILPIIIITGNHDCYNKNSTETSSLALFDKYKNVEVVSELTFHDMNYGRKCMFVPWIDDKKEMEQVLRDNEADYLFVHDDFLNMKSCAKNTVPGGLPYTIVSQYKQVYSGHIHYGQKAKNVTMVGTPYSTSWSDAKNDKYVYLLDFEDMSEKSFLNDYSPKYLEITVDMDNVSKDELNELVKNNFVKINVSTQDFDKSKVTELSESLSAFKSLEVVLPTIDDEVELDVIPGQENTMEELIEIYIDKLQYKDQVKTKLKEVARKIYAAAVEQDREK